ncbi:MAG: twitching motility protein PilT [Lachnospiraceae bacterium]|nr:twitching motility protein PilT [Lachnospiraceae bacterium]
MVNLITGKNGKGKSKILLDKVNSEVKETLGNIVYLDTSTKHMYELNNKIRLINISDYNISSGDMFIGFLLGIISGDHDIQQLYFDNFLSLSHTTMDEIETIVSQLDELCKTFGITVYAAVSTTDKDLPASLSDKVIEAL